MKATHARQLFLKPEAMKPLKRLLALALAILAVGLARAACAAPPASAYVIGPDDVLEFTVANHEDLNRTMTVQQDGSITFPEIGDVAAAGKTPKELAAIIKTELEKTLNRVEVMVSVKEIHSQRVRILGGVRTSGSFDLRANWRMFDLIVAAGGLGQTPSHIAGRIIRHGESIPLDVEQIMARPESQANLLLERDDLILMDDREAGHGLVYVMGQIGRTGAYELSADTTVLSLLTQAGNPTDRTQLSGAYVLRGGKQIPLNLSPTFRGEWDPEVAKFKFQPGDVLFLPTLKTRFAVMGQVGHSGYFPLSENSNVTVIDAVNLSGAAANGDTAKAAILRKVNGKTTVIPVNIDQMLKKGDLSKNISMQPDDILFIPARSNKKLNFGQALADIVAPFTLLSLLGFR